MGIWNWKTLSAAKKMMVQRGAIALVAYEASFAATFYWAYHTKAEGTAIWWLAVPPALVIAGFVLVLAKYLKDETDEFHRELVVRCLLWGLAAVMVVLSYEGLMQLMGWHGTWPVGVDMGVFLVAIAAAKLTYRVANRPPNEDELPAAATEGRA